MTTGKLLLLRWTLRQSRPNKAGLKCPSVLLSVRPSVHKKFLRLQCWRVGRGRRVMHDGMQYDPIKVTSPSKLEIRPFSTDISAIYNGSWQLTTVSQTRAQYLNLIVPDF